MNTRKHWTWIFNKRTQSLWQKDISSNDMSSIKKTKNEVNPNGQADWHPPPLHHPPPRASLLCVNESNWPSCAIGKVRTCRSHFSMCVLTWIMTSHLKLPPPPPTPQPLKGATPLSKIQQTKKGRLAGLHLTVVFLLWMGLPFVRKSEDLNDS